MAKQGILIKGIASFFGIGYLGEGAGSVASVVICLLWYFLKPELIIQITIAIIITIIGVYVSKLLENEWGKDDQKIVIDEVAGMSITLLVIPMEPLYIISGLVAFRFFDIVKPLYVSKMEQFKGGWGVMMDDVLAGVYSNILLQIIIYFNLF